MEAIITEEQTGFKKDRSCVDNVFFNATDCIKTLRIQQKNSLAFLLMRKLLTGLRRIYCGKE